MVVALLVAAGGTPVLAQDPPPPPVPQCPAGVFVFGQLQFLRDRFKDIEYLWAPTGGIGYRLIDTPRVKLSTDAGVGVAIEKNTGLDVDTSGALTAGDKLEVKLSPMATVTQS